MGKAAGIWKKIKTVAKTIGNNFKKALSWANENLLRKNKKYVDPLLDLLPGGGKVKEVVNKASDMLHDYDEKKGYTVDTTVGDKINQGLDAGSKLVRAVKDKKFKIIKGAPKMDKSSLAVSYDNASPDDAW